MIERYATAEAWAKYFQVTESARVHYKTIYNKLRSAGCIGEKARKKAGRVLRGFVFAESDVRKYCCDVLAPLPVADDSGLVIVNGIRYGSIKSLSRLIGVSNTSMEARIRSAGIMPIRGRDIHGVVRDLYPEPEARKLLADLLADLPDADGSGFADIGGVRHGTIHTLARLLRISEPAIMRRVFSAGLTPIRGKIKGGQIYDFYPEPQVRELFADLLAPLPMADESGFADIRGVRHGTLPAIARLLMVTYKVITHRVQSAGLTPVRGKDSGGNIRDFYPEPQVRELFADLLAPMPVADESGFADIGGVRHGTIKSLSDLLGVSNSPMETRIESAGVNAIDGKVILGNIRDFYPEPQDREACADLLAPLPQTGQDGFIEINGVCHGTISSLARLIGLNHRTVWSRVQSAGLTPVHGKDSGGNIRDLYPKPQVRELCADLLSIPIADESGFIEVGGIRLGTLQSFSRLFGFSSATIGQRIKSAGLNAFSGKAISGNACDFYPEPAVREACSDLFAFPMADENGFFSVGGVRHGTVNSFAILMGVSFKVIDFRLRSADITPIRGRSKTGNRDFFPEPRVRELCRDLIEKRNLKLETRNSKKKPFK